MTDNIEVEYTQKHWELLRRLRDEAHTLTRPLTEAQVKRVAGEIRKYFKSNG